MCGFPSIRGMSLRRPIAASLKGASNGSPFFVSPMNKVPTSQSTSIPFCLQEFRAAQPRQQQHPQAMTRVFVILQFEGADEARHFDGGDESFALALAKSHDATGGVLDVLRHIARNFSPVEHLTDDFENVVRCVRVLCTHVRMNRFDIRAGDRIGESRSELRKDSSAQCPSRRFSTGPAFS